MAEAQLQRFLEKVRQLNAFVALTEADPVLRNELRDCDHHDQVVALARRCGFEIGRRWGEPAHSPQAEATAAMTPGGSAEGGNIPVHALGGPAASALAGGLGSLLAGPCPLPGQETTQVLLQSPGWRLERIHSCAAVSPDGFWYDQRESEWLTLLQGSAGLLFADEPDERRLGPGDSLVIAPGRRHRVTATDPAPGTIWLALFWA